jgi:hypothetical protein
MSDFIWGFLGAVAGTVIGVPVLAFLGKAVIDHWLSRRLERFKDQLQLAREKELEELRREWRVAAHQRETRFASWHSRQATILAELYSLLVRAEGSLRPTIPDFKAGPIDDAWRAREELRKYFEENMLFIPDQIANQAGYVLNRLSQVLLRVSTDDIGAEEQDVLAEVLGNEIPRIRKEIREELQTILLGGALNAP